MFSDDDGKQNRKRRDFFDSDDDLFGDDDETIGNITLKTYPKGKRKRSVITSDSDNSDNDDESSIDNFNLKWKNKSRRGIIYSESDDESDESSGSEREEDNLCPICLGEFENQMVGIPENCKHVFCIDCIKEWSKNVNNCPVDRKKFNLIRIKDSKGMLVEELVIEDVKKNEDLYEEPPTYCQVCNECDREDCMLLCDECDNGYHMDCLTPPLEHVPIDQWFCIECAPPPKKTRERSTKVGDQPNRNASFSADESPLDDVAWRGRARSIGESSRTTRSRARTVASTRNNVALRRGQRAVRGASRGRQLSRVSPPKRKKRRTARKPRPKGRKKVSKKTKRSITQEEKIKGELKKVREKIAREEELIRPRGVSLFGDPMYLDEIWDPGDDDEKVESPIRSTIVNTPDVVGSIIGTFESLESNRYVSRDGRGTLIPREEKKSVFEKPQPKAERKRTIRFQTPCDDNRNGKNNDSASDIIGSILGASNILNPGPYEMKIKEESLECIPLQPQKAENIEHKKKMSRIHGDEGVRGNSSNSDGDVKNVKDKKCTEGKSLYDSRRKIKMEEPDYTWADDKKKENSHNEFSQDMKPVIYKKECSEDKQLLLDSMRKRLKASLEKKAKEKMLERECKKMRNVSEVMGFKTDSSLLNVTSFKIPKKRKENSETLWDKEDLKEGSPTRHHEGMTKKSDCKKRPPLTILEKKVKLYNDGVLKPSYNESVLKPSHKKKVKSHKENYEKEKKLKENYEEENKKESNLKNSAGIELKCSSEINSDDQFKNTTDIKETIIPSYHTGTRSLCEDLFGDANLDDDLECITKQEEDISSEIMRSVNEIVSNIATPVSEILPNDTLVERHAADNGIVSGKTVVDAIIDDNTRGGDTGANKGTRSVDLYSKYINPSSSEYNDHEASAYTPCSTCTVPKPSFIINERHSYFEEKQGIAETGLGCESQFNTTVSEIDDDATGNITDTLGELTGYKQSEVKSEIDMFNEKANAVPVKGDLVTSKSDMLNYESSFASEEGDRTHLNQSPVTDTGALQGKCKSSTLSEMNADVPEGDCKFFTSSEMNSTVLEGKCQPSTSSEMDSEVPGGICKSSTSSEMDPKVPDGKCKSPNSSEVYSEVPGEKSSTSSEMNSKVPEGGCKSSTLPEMDSKVPEGEYKSSTSAEMDFKVPEEKSKLSTYFEMNLKDVEGSKHSTSSGTDFKVPEGKCKSLPSSEMDSKVSEGKCKSPTSSVVYSMIPGENCKSPPPPPPPPPPQIDSKVSEMECKPSISTEVYSKVLEGKCKSSASSEMNSNITEGKCNILTPSELYSKVPEVKCKSSTSSENRDDAHNQNASTFKEYEDSDPEKLKNMFAKVALCLSAETNLLKYKPRHLDAIVSEGGSSYRSLESGRDRVTSSDCRLYKELGKQKVESKKAIDTHFIPNSRKHRNNSIPSQKDRHKDGTHLTSSMSAYKGKSKSSRDILAYLNSDDRKEQGKSSTTRSRTDKLSKEQQRHHLLAVKKDIGYGRSNNGKFDRNSPYTVVRPFTQGTTVLTNQAPVAVISPSLRGGSPEQCFKFKETKNTDTYLNTSLTTSNVSIVDNWALKASAWVLNTPTVTTKKRDSSAVNNGTDRTKYGKSEPTIDTMTNTEKNIIFNNRISNETNEQCKSKVPKEVDQESIDKIKAYLKPYYKRRMVTKEQWKAVVKAAVRVIRAKPAKFSTDEDIKVLVQQYVSSYLKP